MRIKLGITGLMILTALCLAAQNLQNVKAEYTAGYSFAKARTFTVFIGTKWGNPTNEEYAKKAVAEQLTSRGYTVASDPLAADLLVVIHGATQDKTTSQKLYSGTGVENFGWAGPAGVTTTFETTYRQGSGVVDIFDVQSERLVFRGVAEDEISMNGEENQKKIDEGVTRMFKDFPARPKE